VNAAENFHRIKLCFSSNARFDENREAVSEIIEGNNASAQKSIMAAAHFSHPFSMALVMVLCRLACHPSASKMIKNLAFIFLCGAKIHQESAFSNY
jgi:hypothetical protein